MRHLQHKVVQALREHGPDAAKIAAVLGVSVGVVEQAMAAVDYSTLTAAVDFSGLGTAIVGIIIALIGVSLLVSGGMAFWKITKQGKNAV